MLLYLINVVENTYLAAIAVPLILFVYRRGSFQNLIKPLAIPGVILGLIAALALAILRRNTGWVIREFYDLGVSIPLVLSLASWLILTNLGQATKVKIWIARLAIAFFLAIGFGALSRASRVFVPSHVIVVSFAVSAVILSFGPARLRRLSAASAVCGALVLTFFTARVAPNLMLYPFEFGIGLDSVFNLDYLLKWVGYFCGLIAVTLLWLSIRAIAHKAGKKIIVWFMFLGLFIVLAQCTLEISQILAARRILSRTLFKIVFFLLERENSFLFAQSVLWGALALIVIFRSKFTKPVGANPALVRKMKAQLISEWRSGVLVLVSLTLLVLTATSFKTFNAREPQIEEPLEVLASGSDIVLDLDVLSDGNLHRHVYKTESGTPVRFIVIKKSQTAFGVGLDACDICGQSGYYQRGDQVICKLCDVVMNKTTIGFPGGCNPVPLAFSLKEGKMHIKTEDLEDEASRFE
ncbi:MAG: Fe-S-containing protein [Deltaproteobacteria bacterium]|jgi:uncharacterized membrane protein|nr:Fe-S-containing protein [Deltaproteobacteria bacterium]